MAQSRIEVRLRAPMIAYDPSHHVENVERAFLAHLWSQFSAGKPIRCLREEHGTLSVSVTQTMPQTYQLRCSHCAWHSEWFFVESGRIRSLQAAPTRRHV